MILTLIVKRVENSDIAVLKIPDIAGNQNKAMLIRSCGNQHIRLGSRDARAAKFSTQSSAADCHRKRDRQNIAPEPGEFFKPPELFFRILMGKPHINFFDRYDAHANDVLLSQPFLHTGIWHTPHHLTDYIGVAEKFHFFLSSD